MEGETPITLDEGWPVVENGYRKLVRIVEGSQEKFSAEEYMDIYRKVYSMCLPNNGEDEYLYGRYKSLIEDYIRAKVLPSLEKKEGMLLREEIGKRWSDHLTMIRWLSRFFNFLSRYYIPKEKLPSLCDAGLQCFQSLVYDAIHDRAKDAFLTVVNEGRESENVDIDVLKRTAELFMSIKPGDKEYDNEMLNLLGTIMVPNEGVAASSH